MEGMQIKHKVLYAGRRKVLRVTSLATIESGPFIAADDPIRDSYRGYISVARHRVVSPPGLKVRGHGRAECRTVMM